MLWGRSASRCSFANCRILLVEDETETDDPSIIGDEAHIVARSQGGPRGDNDLDIDKRDYYDNLILLCKNHHKLVDDQPETYSVDRLREIKNEHLNWVNSSLEIDKQKIKDDEIYAHYIEKWIELAHVDTWEAWSSWVLGSGQPHIAISNITQLQELNKWILNRVWPKRYPELEASFHNFRLILNDFTEIFLKYAEKVGDKNDEDPWYWTEKIYKRVEYSDREAYEELSRKFDFHVDLVMDLMLELTRAANRICDQIRISLSPSFRINEGVLLVQHGPYMDMSFITSRIEYLTDSEEDYKYPGLRKFMEIRNKRDRSFGEGVREDYFLTF